jgi:hypothetical protein
MSEANEVIAATPDRYTGLLHGADHTRRNPDLAWSAGAYVCHVADSLRVWAERLANVVLGDPRPVANYDQDRLADARSYLDIGVRGALWSLGRATNDWQEAFALAAETDFLMVHGELGELTLLDVARIRAHDVTHHAVDIGRSVTPV